MQTAAFRAKPDEAIWGGEQTTGADEVGAGVVGHPKGLPSEAIVVGCAVLRTDPKPTVRVSGNGVDAVLWQAVGFAPCAVNFEHK